MPRATGLWNSVGERPSLAVSASISSQDAHLSPLLPRRRRSSSRRKGLSSSQRELPFVGPGERLWILDIPYGLFADQPAFAQKAEETRHQAGHDAVAQAQADGATGPMTYPLSTSGGSHTADGDWFHASGSFDHNQTGPLTVTDESLAAMHRAGIAREDHLIGESSSQHTERSVP